MKSDSEDSLADSDSQAWGSANTLDEQSDDCQEVCRPASPTQLLQDRTAFAHSGHFGWAHSSTQGLLMGTRTWAANPVAPTTAPQSRG